MGYSKNKRQKVSSLIKARELLKKRRLASEVPQCVKRTKLVSAGNTREATNLVGRRLVAANSLVKTVEDMCNHSRECPIGPVVFRNEAKAGLHTKQIFECPCGALFELSSDDNDVTLNANAAVSWGCQASASGFEDVKTLLTVFDLPTPSYSTFRKNQDETFLEMMDGLDKNMKKWAKEEYDQAIYRGDFIEINGQKYGKITVILDGGWAKRSYKHSFSSSCGIAVIIGACTKKVIYAGTSLIQFLTTS